VGRLSHCQPVPPTIETGRITLTEQGGDRVYAEQAVHGGGQGH
jgi:hypothetical protein